MSATATKITRPWWQVALPGANDVLGAPKQDTGWSGMANPFPMAYDPMKPPGTTDWSAPSTQVPYTAPSTTGGAGGQALPAGFNAWQNYNRPDENAGFNYTQDPYYNAGADRPKWDLAQTGAGSEDDRSRVWRWALDQLGPDPGKRPQAEVQAAYLAAIKRLKGDYQANGYDWASSAYAKYDPYLGGGGATPTPQAGAVAGAAQALGDATEGAGGSTVGPNDPTNPYRDPAVPQGADPPLSPATPTPTAATTVNANGQSVPLGAYYASNPTNAVNQFLASKGVQIGSHDPWSEFLRTLATGIGKTLPQLAPNGPGGTPAYDTLANLPDQLNNLIYGNGGQVFSNVGGYADRALAALTPQINAGMKSTDVESLLQLIEMLKSSGQNPFQKSFNTQQLADLFGQYNQQQQAQGMAGHPLSAAWYLQNDPFGLYGAATGQPR